MKDLEIFRLEDRVLFEAAAVAEIVEAADAASPEQESSDTDSQDQLENAESLSNAPVNNDIVTGSSAIDPEQLADVDAELNALINGMIPGSAENQTAETTTVILQDNGDTISTNRELVIIDSSLKDIDSILTQIRPDQDILILQNDNGLSEVNDFLRESNELYSAIHFITHGDDDGIILNDKIIDLRTFDATEWSELKQHLTNDGDILFYGCNIAENSEGQELIAQIANACDADVAASTDTTGISGNWDLEYRAGVVETVEINADDYRFDLDAVSNFDDLKEALEDAAAGLKGENVTITISADITVENSISVYIKNNLNLTIEGSDKTLSGKPLGEIFCFYDAADKDINISIDQLNFNGQNQAISAIYADGVESLTISNVTLENFTDGALKMLGTGNELLVVENSEFLNNTTVNGGAIFASDISVTIENSYFSGNSSLHNGGALELQNIQNLSITNTTFYQNTAANYGGAVHIVTETNAKIDITNSTFYENNAKDAVATGGGGGAIYIMHSDDSATVTISNSTFANNETDPNGLGSAIGNSDGDIEIKNTLLIGSGDSVVVQENRGIMILTHTLATTSDGNVTVGTGAEVNSEFTFDNVFGSNNTYDPDTHTIAPDAFHKAAYSGTLIGTKDQLGNDRESINTITGLSGKYTIGAVTAAAGLKVTQGDYSTDYTGSVIQPKANLTLAYADGTPMSKTVTDISLTSNPGTILEIGDYTITPSNAKIDGIAADANVEYTYESGTLTVSSWEEISIQDTVISSTYGDDPTLNSNYKITVQDKNNTNSDIVLTVNVTWEIDSSVITYSATNHINAGDYADSLKVKSFTVTDANGTDMKSYFTWDDSVKGDLSVGTKTVTITLNDLADKSYNGKTDDAVFNGGTVSGVVSGETLNVTVAPGYDFGVYNSPNVDASYATFTVALAAGSNTDLANYSFTNQAKANASIIAKKVETVIETSAPYYYNGTDQSGTVSAYYVDINGNKVPLNVDWNGKEFKDAGSYTVTITGNDPNYALVGNVIQLTMNKPAESPTHVYCEGLYPGYFSVIQGMQAELENMTSGSTVYGNIYTMTYPELVSKTMLSNSMPEEFPSPAALWNNEIVCIDTLKYHPFTLDEPVREISTGITGGSTLSHESALYSGEELFSEGGDQNGIQLFKQRGETLSIEYKPLFIEEGVVESEEHSADYVFSPGTMDIPTSVFGMERSLDDQFKGISVVNEAQCRKVENFKSSLEKMLDRICFA